MRDTYRRSAAIKRSLMQFFPPLTGHRERHFTTLAQQPLTLVLDGSVVGRGCVALMLSVVYHGRALPLAWVVIKGKKGHFSQEIHCALLAQVHSLLPPNATVIFLGDGEFDGIELQGAIRAYGWHYVCRTASNILVTACGV